LISSAPVERDQVVLAPAERADVIVDFSGLSEGDEVVMLNLGPDEPFKGFDPAEAQEPADPATTGRVMQFRVVAHTGEGDAGSIPESLPVVTPLTTTLPPRDLTLNEVMYEEADIPIAALLGTSHDGGLTWSDTITETPSVGDTEIWRIVNLTEDAHPIHLHLVMFQVLDRIPFDAEAYADAQGDFLESGGTEPVIDDYFTGAPVEPFPWEVGWKDTVIAQPGEVTRVIATFDLEGLYVWHCHILEHEDNEMMRPFIVEP
jgi:FtsP/CotA-like multicopper oxidase with cupredoxin domain